MSERNVNQPLVGVGVLVLKDGKVLLHRRKGAHGAGEYSFPGGHLEHLESFYDCARRETREECGIEITNIRFQFIANVTRYAPKHYVHVGMIADWQSGEPQTLEPDRGDHWGWHALDELPQPLFTMCREAFVALRTGRTYFDVGDVVWDKE